MYVWAVFCFFGLRLWKIRWALGLEGVGLNALRANIQSKGLGCGA